METLDDVISNTYELFINIIIFVYEWIRAPFAYLGSTIMEWDLWFLDIIYTEKIKIYVLANLRISILENNLLDDVYYNLVSENYGIDFSEEGGYFINTIIPDEDTPNVIINLSIVDENNWQSKIRFIRDDSNGLRSFVIYFAKDPNGEYIELERLENGDRFGIIKNPMTDFEFFLCCQLNQMVKVDLSNDFGEKCFDFGSDIIKTLETIVKEKVPEVDVPEVSEPEGESDQ